MKVRWPFVLLAFIGLVSIAQGGQFYGGKSFLHTNAAIVLPPGALDLSLYVRGFVWIKSSDNYITNGTSALASSFGFSRRVELGYTQILYQDLNQTPRTETATSVMIPGNTYIRFKIAGYPLGDHMYYGFMPALRYRVGKFQDVQLEPYASIGIEPEITGLLSYYVKPLYPDEAPSVHLNLGYLNHNDGDNPGSASQEINWLVSFLVPRPRFDYGAELYGAFFIKRPPVSILGREDWAYLTPMVRYKIFYGMQFTLGLDILLMGRDETTVPRYHSDLNYATWRLSGKVNLIPSTPFYAAPTFVKGDVKGVAGREKRGGVATAPSFSRQELLRWSIEEKGLDVQSLELDLEKIRQERKKAEEELLRLKQKLEERQKREQSSP